MTLSPAPVTITYAVRPACSAIVGFGRVSAPGIGNATIADQLTTSQQDSELFATSPPLVLQLSKLEDAACTKTHTGAVFSADGQALLQGHPGYEIALTFRNVVGNSYLSLNLSKRSRKVFTLANAKLAPGSKEHIS